MGDLGKLDVLLYSGVRFLPIQPLQKSVCQKVASWKLDVQYAFRFALYEVLEQLAYTTEGKCMAENFSSVTASQCRI